MDNKTLWVSDTDLNGLDTVARITKMDDSYFLEVTTAKRAGFIERVKQAWRVLVGKSSVVSFVILSDKDAWVRGIEDGGKNSKNK